MYDTHNTDSRIRRAVQEMHRDYIKHPGIFLTEADIQCTLYAKLLNEFSKVRDVNAFDAGGKQIPELEGLAYTRSLHAELSSRNRKSTEFVDICILRNLSTLNFCFKKSKLGYPRRFPLHWSEWEESHSIGIEIKMNDYAYKPKASFYKKRKGGWRRITKTTKKWENFEWSLKRDLSKLRRYKRGWLILVDHYSLFNSFEEWRTFMRKIIQEANYGRAKKSLNAYYLSPNVGKALRYRPQGSKF